MCIYIHMYICVYVRDILVELALHLKITFTCAYKILLNELSNQSMNVENMKKRIECLTIGKLLS